MAVTTDPSRRDTPRRRLFDEKNGQGGALEETPKLDEQISKMSGKLDFDVDRERQARTQMIESQAQQARERLGRTFAISPGGLQQGGAISRFAGLEAQRLGQIAGLETELSQRGPAEARANLGVLGGLRAQQQQAGLARRGIEAQERQFTKTLEQRGKEQQEQFTEAQRQFDIQTSARADEFAESLGLSKEQFEEAKEQFDAGVVLKDEQLAEGIRQFNLELEQRETESEQQFGLSERELDLRGEQFDESRRQFDVSTAVNQEQFAANIGLSEDQLTENRRQFNLQTDIRGNEFAETMGLSREQFDQERAKYRAGMDLDNRKLMEQMRQFDEESTRREAEFNETLGLQRDELGERIASRIATQTLGERELDIRDSIENGRLSLAKDQLAANSSQFQQSLETSVSQFSAQFGLSERQFEEAVRQFASGETFQDKNFEESIRQFTESFEEQTRQFDTTVGEQQRQFDANIKQRSEEFSKTYGLHEAEIFGGAPSVNFTQGEFEDSFNSELGDDNYREDLDTNNDGIVDFTDFSDLAANSVDLGNGIRQWVPKGGRRTLMAQKFDQVKSEFAQTFGLQEEQVDIAVEQFDKNFEQDISRFLSNFTGKSVDAQGRVTHIYDNEAKEWVQGTSLQAEQMDTQVSQFNKQMDMHMDQFDKQLGLEKGKLSAKMTALKAQLIVTAAGKAGDVGLFDNMADKIKGFFSKGKKKGVRQTALDMIAGDSKFSGKDWTDSLGSTYGLDENYRDDMDLDQDGAITEEDIKLADEGGFNIGRDDGNRRESTDGGYDVSSFLGDARSFDFKEGAKTAGRVALEKYGKKVGKAVAKRAGRVASDFIIDNVPGGRTAVNAGKKIFSFLSDENMKTDVVPLGTREDVLEQVRSMPISTWRYKGDSARHIGPMAQDFRKAFGLGSSEKQIDVVDAVGVNFASVQALADQVDRLERRI